MTAPLLHRYRRTFVDALAAALEKPREQIEALVKPAEPAHGDFSFPTFALAKERKAPPPAIAATLAPQLAVPGLAVVSAGPYVNATIDGVDFATRVLGEMTAEFGASDAEAGKTVVIDFSSPNIAKPIAFHHIRSTVIGNALANIHRACGARVEGINYLGDWGKQFGLVAIGLEAFGDPARRHEMAHLVEVYVKANQRAEAEPEFDERARGFFRKMEAADPAATALWTELRDVSLKDFKAIYSRLGVRFEHFEGESRYQNKMDGVIAEITRSPGTKISEGALIVDMPYEKNEPPVLLKKADGSTLYATRDLAAAIDRFERFNFDQALYVVATDQALHFRQFFRVLEAMGRPWAKRLVHVNFGHVHGMSTRKGQIHLLNDVLDEAKNRALEKVQENITAGKIDTANPDELAEPIGVGAIVFGDLKNRRATDYSFDWNDVLSMEGHTGVYLQYAHARACQILEKGGGKPKAFDPALLTLPEEQSLLRAVASLPVAVVDAASQQEPSLVARSLLDLAAAFSRWYTLGNHDRSKRVLVEDNPSVRAARLALTDAVRLAMHNGLALLGIRAPTRM